MRMKLLFLNHENHLIIFQVVPSSPFLKRQFNSIVVADCCSNKSFLQTIIYKYERNHKVQNVKYAQCVENTILEHCIYWLSENN